MCNCNFDSSLCFCVIFRHHLFLVLYDIETLYMYYDVKRLAVVTIDGNQPHDQVEIWCNKQIFKKNAPAIFISRE